MEELRLPSGHVPPNLVEPNYYTRRLLAVLDAIATKRYEVIEHYADSFDPQLNTKIEDLRRFIDDFGGEYLLSTTKAALECLYFNKYEIFDSKGTDYGLIKLLTCLSGGIVTINISYPYPLIHFFTLDGGILPNGQDLQDELNPQTPLTVPKWIPTLLDDSWSAYYYTLVNITIASSTDTSQVFTDFIKRIVPLYGWYIDPNSSTINVNYI
jgi:hypothetical protein